MNCDFHVIIPARYQSTRLPGKLLLPIGNQSVIERVYRQAELAEPCSITIATDSELIAEHALKFGAEIMMTSTRHETGSDRLAEVVVRKKFAPDTIIVNVQGDEPFISPALIKQVAELLAEAKDDTGVASLCWPIESQLQLSNPNVVKVVLDKHYNALYFSRSCIPAHRDDPSDIRHSFRHIGLYAYLAGFLVDYVHWPVCAIEQAEALEMLRILWEGHKIKMAIACTQPCQDINTAEDLAKARELYQLNPA